MKISVTRFVFALLLMFTLTAGAWAGTQLSGLMGGDVTDPENKIHVPEGNITYPGEEEWAAYYTDATWVNISSYKRNPYSALESPSNLFNNKTGGMQWKWNDSQGPSVSNPSQVTVQFPEPFVLTHFTLSSANDSWNYNRQPNEWTVYGSNDGTTWTTIYHANSSDDFTQANNKTILYSSFTNETLSSTILNADQKTAVTNSLGSATISAPDFATPNAYSWYKLEVTSTVGTSGTGGTTQIGEWELFGNISSSARTSGNPFSPLTNVTKVYSLDAQNTASLTLDENYKVSAWADSDSNGVVFSQPTEEFRPTLSAITINGQEFKALDFTKTARDDDHPQGGDNLIANKRVNAQTVFILAQNDINASLTGIWGQSNDFGIRLSSGTGLWQDSPGNESDFINAQYGTPNGQYYYNGVEKSEFTGVLKDNLVLTEAARNEPFTFTANRIGSYFMWSNYDPGSRGYDGKILAVAVYDSALTDYETKFVNTGFALEYGLEIANMLDVLPGPVTETAYRNDLIGIINRTIDGKEYFQDCSGEGGLGIYGKITGTRPAESAFDIFNLTTYQTPSDGTEIYAVANMPAGTAAGILTEIEGIKGSTYDKWAKEWYFTNKSEGAQDWEITLEFNAEEANFTDFESYADSEWYLISKTEEGGQYFRVGDLDPQKFNEKMISFTFPASLLQTGFYTLGVMTAPEVPEPAAWILILVGLAGIGVARKRLLHPAA